MGPRLRQTCGCLSFMGFAANDVEVYEEAAAHVLVLWIASSGHRTYGGVGVLRLRHFNADRVWGVGVQEHRVHSLHCASQVTGLISVVICISRVLSVERRVLENRDPTIQGSHQDEDAALSWKPLSGLLGRPSVQASGL